MPAQRGEESSSDDSPPVLGEVVKEVCDKVAGQEKSEMQQGTTHRRKSEVSRLVEGCSEAGEHMGLISRAEDSEVLRDASADQQLLEAEKESHRRTLAKLAETRRTVNKLEEQVCS